MTEIKWQGNKGTVQVGWQKEDKMTETEELQKIIDEHSRIVLLGGAGVPAESGIPDFRSVDGLYNQKY